MPTLPNTDNPSPGIEAKVFPVQPIPTFPPTKSVDPGVEAPIPKLIPTFPPLNMAAGAVYPVPTPNISTLNPTVPELTPIPTIPCDNNPPGPNPNPPPTYNWLFIKAFSLT